MIWFITDLIIPSGKDRDSPSICKAFLIAVIVFIINQRHILSQKSLNKKIIEII